MNNVVYLWEQYIVQGSNSHIPWLGLEHCVNNRARIRKLLKRISRLLREREMSMDNVGLLIHHSCHHPLQALSIFSKHMATSSCCAWHIFNIFLHRSDSQSSSSLWGTRHLPADGALLLVRLSRWHYTVHWTVTDPPARRTKLIPDLQFDFKECMRCKIVSPPSGSSSLRHTAVVLMPPL